VSASGGSSGAGVFSFGSVFFGQAKKMNNNINYIKRVNISAKKEKQ
jgi:hypothetical protein